MLPLLWSTQSLLLFQCRVKKSTVVVTVATASAVLSQSIVPINRVPVLCHVFSQILEGFIWTRCRRWR